MRIQNVYSSTVPEIEEFHKHFTNFRKYEYEDDWSAEHEGLMHIWKNETYLGFFTSDVPNPDSLVVGAAGDKLPAWAHSGHPNPFPVAGQSLDAVARRDLPNFDGLVSGWADDEITLGHERHRAHIVVVSVHRLDTRERLREVP